MDTDQTLDSVELMAGVDRDGAQLAVDATLLTLAERVGRAAAAGLAGGLPGELEAVLTAGPDAGEPFDAEEFARRTAVRARVDPGRGREYATAVLATLREDVAGIQEPTCSGTASAAAWLRQCSPSATERSGLGRAA